MLPYLKLRNQLIDLAQPKIMGILNITADSFYDGGKYQQHTAALKRVEQMLNEGVDIVDIGAQSTRPGAKLLSAQDEIAQIGSLMADIRQEFPSLYISVDTFYAEVLRKANGDGADLLNDISAGQFDPELWPTLAQTNMAYVLMHVNDSYKTMHQALPTDDLLPEMSFFFSEKLAQLQQLKISDVLIDPGFGFGKSVPAQIKLINELEALQLFDNPLLIGISRKSMLYKNLGKSPDEVLMETNILHYQALKQGAKILRVHDVAAAKACIDLYAVFG
jgi:dihydropteroate synthase